MFWVRNNRQMCCTGLNKAYMCRTRSFNDAVIFSRLFIVLSEQIVYIKPPWTLRDILQCLKKHWIAVFGQVVPRRKLQTVLNLIDFFKSGMYFSCKYSPNVNFIVFNSLHMRTVSPFFLPINKLYLRHMFRFCSN